MNWCARAAGLPPFLPATVAALDRLAPIAVPEGTVLFRPGETVKGFVIVLRGRVEVYLTGLSGREILLYEVAPGQSCVQSTLGLMGGEDYSGEAVAREQCEVVLIPREIFLRFMDGDPAFRNFVFAAFAARLQSMMHLLDRVAFQRVETRLAACLLARAEGGAVNATHAEIAVQIGTAREVVSRRLDALARRGIVALSRGQVRIIDAQALTEIAALPG
ncbi:Crp/Fnr family transcriptional regulator [Roseovarius autotrophicus]|uniref:Crp/Fnr family transcriptional regulator n=1 Tax=Roseovarius autotrophicus TaxID=2824121 RepID=UPI0019D9B4C1|nr:Crp/Fnr family transcriptional regulator [Roseovarius autotrophicus]MBE0455453.1 Crp/Fnr family transcriptional regulator [Roseovarius sp.]